MLPINSIDKQPPGPSYWKFNSSLLDDLKYIDLIENNVPLWLTEFKDVLDKSRLWDFIKYKIRQLTMKCSKTKARERRSRLCEIEKKLRRFPLNVRAVSAKIKLPKKYLQHCHILRTDKKNLSLLLLPS